MKTIIINKNDVNKRLDNFLFKLFPNISKSNIYKLIRNKSIKLNDKKIDFNYRLMLNDEIKIYINMNNKPLDYLFTQTKPNIKVIYEDNNIIIINKDVGQLVYDEKNKLNETLLNKVKHYLYLKKEYNPELENSFTISAAHRLDTNTRGLIIFAKNAESLKELNYIFKEKLIIKSYIALVYGIIKKNGIINCFIKKDENKNIVYCSYDKKDKFYKESITKYNVIQTIKNKFTMVDINLITGRTHQIRASFNLLGYPLVGEKKYISKYIDKDFRFKHQCLISYKLKFKNLYELNKLKYLSNKEFEIKDIKFEV